MTVRVERVRCGVTPGPHHERTELSRSHAQRPLVRGLWIRDDEIQLAARRACRMRRIRQSGPEQRLDSAFRHQAQDAAAWKRELGHSRNAQPRGQLQGRRIEGLAARLIGDVEDEVRDSPHRRRRASPNAEAQPPRTAERFSAARATYQVQNSAATPSQWSNGYAYLALKRPWVAGTVGALRIVLKAWTIIELETAGG